MRVKFWGTHGSLPSPVTHEQVRGKLREALLRAARADLSSPEAVDAFIDSLPFPLCATYGGNTACIAIRNHANDLLIIDAGSGIRGLGRELLADEFGQGQGVANILFSHFHWDHIQGFPFFAPVYVKGNRITLWGKAPCDLREVFERQQLGPFFPVGIDSLAATIEFRELGETLELCEGRFLIRTIALDHPGKSYAFRIQSDGATVVYASDAEYKRGDDRSLKPYVEFYRNADALIFDAQFSVVESIFEKRDWGHSAAPMGVEIACAASVKKLVLFHHDPGSDDFAIAKTLHDAQEYAKHVPADAPPQVIAAYDGMELDLSIGNPDPSGSETA